MIELQQIALSAIVESTFNPRKTFNPAKLAELAESIKANGVLQPILVRTLPGARLADTDRAVQFEIIAGARRYRASQVAGVTNIPAIVRTMTDSEAMEAAILENLQRDDLTELEEAEGYEQLMQHASITADQVGTKIGKSRSYVYSRLKLLDLSMECKQALREGKIDASRALLIARIPDGKLQLKALKFATDPMGYPPEPPSVRRLQDWLKANVMLRLDSAIFKITDSRLVTEAGNCTECPKRTGANPDLFADVASADICTDPTCFHGKEEAHRDQLRKKADAKGMRIVEGKEALELLGGRSYCDTPVGYDDLSEKCPELGQEGDKVQTLGELLGKDAPEAILFIHPRTQQMTELVPTDKANAVLLTKGIKAEMDEEDQHQGNPENELEQLQKRAAADTERAVHNATFSTTVDAVRATDAKRIATLLCSGDLLRAALLNKLDNYLNAEDMALALGYTFQDGEDENDGLAMHIRATTTENLCKALVICELLDDRHHSVHQQPLILQAIAQALDVDAQAIANQATAKVKAEYADRLKAAKAKIDAKKQKLAPPPAARPQEGAGGAKSEAKGKSAAAKKTPVRAAKLSAEEATLGIAAAMQGLDGAASAPVGAVALPAEPAEGSPGQAIGVCLANGTAVKALAGKCKGKEGVVLKNLGDDCYTVKLKGVGAALSYRLDQLEVMGVAA